MPECRCARVRRAAPSLHAAPSALSFALAARARGAPGYDLVQSHERDARARTSTGRGRAATAATWPRWAGGRARTRPPSGLRARAAHLRSAGRASRGRDLARRRGRDRAALRTPSAALTVVYNGVDLERFHPDNAPATARPRGPRSASRRARGRVLFVGSGFERKGLGPADRGASRVCPMRPARARLAWWSPARATCARYQRLAARELGVGRPRGLARARAGGGAPLRGGRRGRAARALRAVRQRPPGGARLRRAGADQRARRRCRGRSVRARTAGSSTRWRRSRSRDGLAALREAPAGGCERARLAPPRSRSPTPRRPPAFERVYRRLAATRQPRQTLDFH